MSVSTHSSRKNTLLVCPGQTTGIPCFSKICVTPFHFYKRPALAPVFTKQTNIIQVRFLLLWKKVKSENSVEHLFCSKLLHRLCTTQIARGLTYNHARPQAARALNCLWASVLYLDFCVHLLARCALNYQIKLRWFFGSGKAQKVFHVNKW